MGYATSVIAVTPLQLQFCNASKPTRVRGAADLTG
jgi:hypothetical protein